jgi:hypothetical protein
MFLHWGLFKNHSQTTKHNKMRDTILRIITQSEENYGDSHHPHWKKKGMVEFTLMVDEDKFMYNEDVWVNTIQEILEREESNNCIRFTYLTHELVFRSCKMDDNVFEQALTNNYHKFLEEKVWDNIYKD